jgi:hypothetical protein
MRRTVRNGLAIAGMAGGIFFLGEAVAGADEGQTNTTGQENSQSATSEDGGGATGNIGGNENESSNEVDVDVETDVEGGDGGYNESNVNTGAQEALIIVVANDEEEAKVLAEYAAQNGTNGGHGEDAEGEINIETDSVSVEQNANGGNVDNSGNVDPGKLELPDQTNNVDQSNNQTATSEDDDHHGRPHHGDWDNKEDCNETPSLLSSEECNEHNGHHGNDGVTGNIGGNSNESENEVDIDIETDVEGGDGGENYSNVNTGLQDVVFKCIAIGGGDAKCVFNISTGSVTVIQNANGGNVSNSGNVGSTKPEGRDHHARPHRDAAKHFAPHRAPALSSAQPSGQLAFTGSTGSDVSAPLTLGLLALGAGAGLTLLGRRSANAA